METVSSFLSVNCCTAFAKYGLAWETFNPLKHKVVQILSEDSAYTYIKLLHYEDQLVNVVQANNRSLR